MGEKIAFLLAGWLLGLLGPAIVDAIRRRRENALGRAAMLSEVHELASRLALAAYGVRLHQGKVTREFVEWLKEDIEVSGTLPDLKDQVPRLRDILSWTPESLDGFNLGAQNGPRKGTMLQRLRAPLLDSRVSALWSFDTSFQRNLLSIHHRLALLDDLVERSRKYFDLTFTKLEGANESLVRENLEQVCYLYAESAERLVKEIRRLPKL